MAKAGAALPRPLRVALIWNGGLLEDRILREHVPVVLGESQARTFQAPIDGADV